MGSFFLKKAYPLATQSGLDIGTKKFQLQPTKKETMEKVIEDPQFYTFDDKEAMFHTLKNLEPQTEILNTFSLRDGKKLTGLAFKKRSPWRKVISKGIRTLHKLLF